MWSTFAPMLSKISLEKYFRHQRNDKLLVLKWSLRWLPTSHKSTQHIYKVRYNRLLITVGIWCVWEVYFFQSLKARGKSRPKQLIYQLTIKKHPEMWITSHDKLIGDKIRCKLFLREREEKRNSLQQGLKSLNLHGFIVRQIPRSK